jgi:hypothetical protein
MGEKVGVRARKTVILHLFHLSDFPAKVTFFSWKMPNYVSDGSAKGVNATEKIIDAAH